MKNMKSLSALFLIFIMTAAVSAQKAPKEVFIFPPLDKIRKPDIVQHTLSNGIRLILIEDKKYPTVDVRGMVYTGAVFDPKGKEGLADLTAAVMRSGGSAELPGDKLDEKLESAAASVECMMGSDAGYFSASSLKEHSDFVMTQLRNIVVNPAFPADKISIEKDDMKSEIAKRNDNPGSIQGREFPKMVFGDDSPYIRQEEYKSVNSITRKDLVSFHGKYYVPENMIIAVWGDFNSPEMITKMEKLWGSWKKSGRSRPRYPEVSEKKGTQIEYAEKKDLNQASIIIGHIGGLYRDEDYAAMTVMSRILSFDRLFKILRTDAGLAYQVWGSYGAGFIRPSTFNMGIQTKSETAVQSMRMILSEMDRITSEEVSAKELQQAKERIINSFVFEYDSSAKIARRILTYSYYGYPLDYNETLLSKISSVTSKDILAAARKNLKKENLKYLIIGNKSNFDSGLESLGTVKKRDISIPEEKK